MTEATTSKASAAAIKAATARSHAGEATIAVAACVGSIESPGTTSERIPVACTAARKITTAYTIGSARAKTGAAGAIRATNASCPVAKTCISPQVACTTTCGRPTRDLSTLSSNLLPGAGLTLGK
jgi:hypothetical protein